MFKFTWSLFAAFLMLFWYSPRQNHPKTTKSPAVVSFADSLPNAKSWPAELNITGFAGPDLTPSPACLAVAPTGEVFVGVDMIGSLGKTPGKGSIVKLVDSNNDGVVDKHTVFAMADDPRGIIALGDQVFVLHTTFSSETGKASGMDLVVFEDRNRDGVADGPSQPLIQNISSAKFLQSRGTDHATNGIRMGIDGWIYIAVGDFGFHNAVDRSGKKLTQLGGGIVRVRPNGTEMEVYTHGLRNIYDVAIDPFMNIFTRDNTNDGGGWNIRFSHQIQSGEYGYPLLFQHFTDEIIPALVDLGGGSGTGSLFMDDATWPAKYNKVPMMADWGRSQAYVHRVTPDGATFKQQEEGFIQLSQITDLDVDASGRLYLAAWDGAGYSGNPKKGFVVRAVPKDWKYTAFPDLKKSSVAELVGFLKSESAVARLHAQQELLSRGGKQAADEGWKIAADKALPLHIRVAGIYTYAQAAGESGIANLAKLSSENEVREFALRAMADRKIYNKNVAAEPFLKGIKDPSIRVRVASMIGLGRLGRVDAAKALLQTRVPSSFVAPERHVEGPHATPNAAIVPAHIAVRALVSLNAVDACVNAIPTPNGTLALWALRYMHDPKAVNGLIAAYKKSKDVNLKNQILITLSRLYTKEAPYEGLTWWSTRPDSHGPYYKGVEWESSPAIKTLLTEEWNKADAAGTEFFADLNGRHRMGIAEFGGEDAVAVNGETKVDLNKIKNKKGQVGDASIEDVMLAMAKTKGDPALGKTLFTRQGCVACHSLQKGETMKGPFMGQIGSIMNREQIAESILKPNASISQGFSTVLITAKGDKTYMGFVTQESADRIVMRNITGDVFTVKTSDIISRKEMENSMMPEGLANALSYEEFASLLTFLSQQKK
jgi:putative heme-binding domain-containing protein